MSRYINVKNGKEALDELIARYNNDVYPSGYSSFERFRIEEDYNAYDYIAGYKYNDKLELRPEQEGDKLYLVKIEAR